MVHLLLKMDTENSWSRCEKEFSSFIDNGEAEGNERFFSRKFGESRNNSKRKFNSINDPLYRKNVVATDAALANIEEIESTELVSKWIADGIRTPTKFEQNSVSQSTEKISELEKSPVINCRPRSVRSSNRNKKRQNLSPDLKKSPVIGSSRLFKKRRKRFDSFDRRKKKESCKFLNVDRTSIFGREEIQSLEKGGNISSVSSCGFLFVDVNRSPSPPGSEERRLNSLNYETVLNGKGDLRGFRESDDFQKVFDTLNDFELYEDDVLSQDLFDDYEESKETSFIDKTLTEKETDLISRPGIENSFKEEEILGLDIGSNNSSSSGFWRNGKYVSKEYNLEKDSCKIELVSGKSSSISFIQDTEELFSFAVAEKNPAEERGEELFIVDSELSQVKTDFVQDTENIDYDTSSDSSNSDRTVSDIIEEPLTQDCVEIYKPKINETSSNLINSVSAPSLKISGTISVDISIEDTQPKTQESFSHIPELNFSLTKKKKRRVKKGSLSERLRKLVSSDISSVRLWRHQMSNDPIFQNSTTPFTMLSVIEHSVKCEINFYRSKIIEDPFDLLKVYFDDLDNEDKKGNGVKNIVVITRPEFTGRVILPSGTLFNLYKPWKIYNNSYDTKRGKRDLIIHALYFKIISIAGKFNNKDDEGDNFNRSHNSVKNFQNNFQIIKNDYHCPCLINNKIDDSCTSKFTDNQKVNLMNVILYNK